VGIETAEYKELPELKQDVHPEQVLQKSKRPKSGFGRSQRAIEKEGCG
jgi:hypothetical protein